ncbi:MAG: hypothetical protein JXA15_13250 [Spirochaetales bacterium]|nr:hypothetical protein [Spirochaetales bacterium]
MVIVYVKIDFWQQYKRVDPRRAAALQARLRAAGEAFAGKALSREDPFALVFDEEGLFWRIQAAEAAFRIRDTLEDDAWGIDDYMILLHRADDEERGFRELRRAWATSEGPGGVRVTAEGLPSLAAHLATREGEAPRHVVGPAYRDNPENVKAGALLSRPGATKAAAEALRKALASDVGILAFKGPPGSGRGAAVQAALASLGHDPSSFPAWRGRGSDRPFAPLLPLAALPASPEALDAGTEDERVELETLAEAGAAALASPFRAMFSETLTTGLGASIGASLEALAASLAEAGLPPLMVLRDADKCSPQAIEAMGSLAERGRALVVCTISGDPPEVWSRARVSVVELAPEPEDEIARKIGEAGIADAEALARATRGDLRSLGHRAALALRNHPAAVSPRHERAAFALLSLLPREAALVLYAYALAEGILRPGEVDEFLEGAGLHEEAGNLVRRILLDLGFLDADGGISGDMTASDIERAARGPTEETESPAARIRELFAERLIFLNSRGRLAADLGFLAALESLSPASAAKSGRRGLPLECAYGEAQRDRPGRAPPLRGAFAPAILLGAFATAQALGDRENAQAALAAYRDLGRAGIGDGVLELMEAEHQNALRNPKEAAIKAKGALIAARGSCGPKAESRAHRALGLASLGQGRVVEGLDYLRNALELAEGSNDDFEIMAALEGTVAANFTTGDAWRALRAADSGLAHARALFRKDHEAWLEFAAGRANFALGRYELATLRYRRAAFIGARYSLDGCAARAEIWTGRALAWAGRGPEAREVIARHAGDAEAAWFLAELELLEGRHREATELAASATALPNAEYRGCDAIFWDSGFRQLEGRGVGFGDGRSADQDFLRAFALFARGMAEDDPTPAVEIHAMTRESRISDESPEFIRYFYYCYLLLEDRPDAPLDKHSMLSRSFKYLQERAGRIDDPAVKASFLERDPWNRGILEAAKRYKFL